MILTNILLVFLIGNLLISSLILSFLFFNIQQQQVHSTQSIDAITNTINNVQHQTFDLLNQQGNLSQAQRHKLLESLENLPLILNEQQVLLNRTLMNQELIKHGINETYIDNKLIKSDLNQTVDKSILQANQGINDIKNILQNKTR